MKLNQAFKWVDADRYPPAEDDKRPYLCWLVRSTDDREPIIATYQGNGIWADKNEKRYSNIEYYCPIAPPSG